MAMAGAYATLFINVFPALKDGEDVMWWFWIAQSKNGRQGVEWK